MATGFNKDIFVPQIYVDCLMDVEIKYELSIRKLFVVSDNKLRRKSKLKTILAVENATDTPLQYKSLLTFEEDFIEAMMVFATIKSVCEEEKPFERVNAKSIESHVAHLMGRLGRMSPPDSHREYVTVNATIKNIFKSLVDYYAGLDDNQFNILNESVSNEIPDDFPSRTPNNNGTPPTTNPSSNSDPSNVFPQNNPAFVQMLERTINNILDRRLPSHTSATHFNHGPSHFPNNRCNGRTPAHNHAHNGDDDSFSDLGHSDRESGHSPHANRYSRRSNRNNFRPSSTHIHSQFDYAVANPNAVNVLDWKFSFSGLAYAEDPKAIDLESFLRRIKDHLQASRISEGEMMSKIQLLLRGPASDWFMHARRSINSWSQYKQKIRNRLSSANSIETLRQQIYSKKQQSGEYTLRFIDQFVNLIDRLPEAVSERQCVRYILSGIKLDIARMARTANIVSVEDLIDYVKENYGPYDRIEPRPCDRINPKLAISRPSNHRVEQIDTLDEHYSESGSEEVFELNEIANHKSVGEINKFGGPPMNFASNRFQDSAPIIASTTIPPQNPNKTLCNRCGSTSLDSNRSKVGGICPYCGDSHSFRQCPLPGDKKLRHCFVCKSTSHIAPRCPTYQNNP